MDRKKIITISIIVLVLIVFGIYNGITNKEFWNMSLYNILTLLVAVVVAFYFTQKNNDIRKTKEKAENIFEKIQDIINQDKYYRIDEKTDERELNMMKRTVNNKLKLLEKESSIINNDSEMKYLREKFDEYRAFIDDHINDKKYLEKSEIELKKILNLMDDKIDEIRLKLYK